MPRRKPDGKSVVVNRLELGDFERRQLEDAKLALAVAAVTPAVGLAAIGIGVGMAGLFIGNSLKEIQEWFDEGKQKMWGLGHSDDSISQSTTDAPADLNDKQMPNIDGDKFPGIPDFEGMSPATIYETVNSARGDIQDYAMELWMTTNGLESRPFTRTTFYDGCTSPLLKRRFFADTRVFEGDDVSNFTYQMAIRETAARRNQGRAASTVAGLLTGWGVIASEAVWRIGNWLGIGHASDWTSGDVTEAPGYIDDPLLDWIRTIVDFPGNDASHFGTYDYEGLWTGGHAVHNIASRNYVEDILKMKSSIDNTLNIDELNNFLSGQFPNPPS